MMKESYKAAIGQLKAITGRDDLIEPAKAYVEALEARLEQATGLLRDTLEASREDEVISDELHEAIDSFVAEDEVEIQAEAVTEEEASEQQQ